MTTGDFEKLIKEHKNKLYRFAFSILKNSEDAQDAVQELVLKLWKHKCSLDDNTGNKTIDETFAVLSQNEKASYFEVTSEMFKMLSEAKNTSPEFRDYISKVQNLKLIEAKGGQTGTEFYQFFLMQTNLEDYSVLMTKKQGQSQLTFFKKEGATVNKFLLVSTDVIIYIAGTIELKSLGEFEQVMEIAGSAFDM